MSAYAIGIVSIFMAVGPALMILNKEILDKVDFRVSAELSAQVPREQSARQPAPGCATATEVKAWLSTASHPRLEHGACGLWNFYACPLRSRQAAARTRKDGHLALLGHAMPPCRSVSRSDAGVWQRAVSVYGNLIGPGVEIFHPHCDSWCHLRAAGSQGIPAIKRSSSCFVRRHGHGGKRRLVSDCVRLDACIGRFAGGGYETCHDGLPALGCKNASPRVHVLFGPRRRPVLACLGHSS